MNENSKGNSNMNPEQARLAALHQERERLTWEQHKRAQEPEPAQIKERKRAYRAELLRLFIMRNYPNETKAQQEAHLRQLLGDPEPVKKAPAKPAKKPAPAPIRKDSRAKTAELKKWLEAMNAYNVSRAAQFGIKNPGEIQYR